MQIAQVYTDIFMLNAILHIAIYMLQYNHARQ
nr:MAG TPA: hypothetical protein [Caudoviricetes sp.]